MKATEITNYTCYSWLQQANGKIAVDDFSYRNFCSIPSSCYCAPCTGKQVTLIRVAREDCDGSATQPQHTAYLLLKRVNFFKDTNLNYFSSMLNCWVRIYQCRKWRKSGDRKRSEKKVSEQARGHEIKYMQLFSRCTNAAHIVRKNAANANVIMCGACNFVSRSKSGSEAKRILSVT